MATNELAASRTVERPPSGLFAIGMNPLTVLGWIGPDSLPALTMILSNYNEPDIRYTTIQALEIIGTNAAPAVPALLPCLNDKNEMVAWEAVRVLGQIHSRQQVAFVALTNILQTRPAVRSEAVVALAGFGDEALPILFKGLEGPNSVAYFMVGTPWIQKSPQVLTNAALLKILAAGLQSSNVETRDWAAGMLRAAGEQSRGSRPQHPAEQEEGMRRIRAQATNALRSLAPQLLPNSSP
jgi:HEAT repeat protein